MCIRDRVIRSGVFLGLRSTVSSNDDEDRYGSRSSYRKMCIRDSFRPEEVRVKHVLIGLSQEDLDKYDQLMADGKETEAKEHLEEKLKEIEPRAMEVLEKAQIGEDFEKLIEEYGDVYKRQEISLGFLQIEAINSHYHYMSYRCV